MGHIRLGVLPKSKKWEQVIALLDGGAAVQTIVASAAEAAEGALKRAAGDPGFSHAFWLLTQLPLAACQADFAGELHRLGLRVGKSLEFRHFRGRLWTWVLDLALAPGFILDW